MISDKGTLLESKKKIDGDFGREKGISANVKLVINQGSANTLRTAFDNDFVYALAPFAAFCGAIFFTMKCKMDAMSQPTNGPMIRATIRCAAT